MFTFFLMTLEELRGYATRVCDRATDLVAHSQDKWSEKLKTAFHRPVFSLTWKTNTANQPDHTLPYGAKLEP